ncbi:MAG: type II toxin-antitoxin system HicB family antitoxin [Synergistaceae bacterium]|nr:type II toxin-antitoxin system HicB family antitoxin [Synergistaceae bacterium]
MQDNYTFPAIFDYANDGISIFFPDLANCFSCADNNSEAVFMATDALSLRLISYEEDGSPIPEPSDVFEIKKRLEPNQILTLICVYMPHARKRFNDYGCKRHQLFTNSKKTEKVIIPNLGGKMLPEKLSGKIIQFVKTYHEGD